MKPRGGHDTASMKRADLFLTDSILCPHPGGVLISLVIIISSPLEPIFDLLSSLFPTEDALPRRIFAL